MRICFSRFDFGLSVIDVRFWPMNRGNQPYFSRNESKVSSRDIQLKNTLLQRGISSFCPRCIIRRQYSEAVPRPKIGLFFDLKLFHLSIFFLIGQSTEIRTAPVEKGIFGPGTSRRVSGLIPRSARRTPWLCGRSVVRLRLAGKTKSTREKKGAP